MSSNLRPRWLVIAHAFNMDGRAASQTITDKLPHLQNAGIEIVVLSGVSGRHDTQVEHHQLWPLGPAGFKFELRHVLRKRWGKGFIYRLCMTLASIALLPFITIEKLIWPIESSWTWWLSAYLKGRSLARQNPFDLIYSTGGAFAAHIAGHALKHATGTPWLAEVHDPLVTPGKKATTRQEKMQLCVEEKICSEADVAIWFTDQALASAHQRHPQLGHRGKMMLPGIDNPFKTLPPYLQSNKFIIGHFGSLSPTRHLGPIIEALEQLFYKRPELKDVVELHVYGGPLDKISASLILSSNVKLCVHHFGRIDANSVTGLSGREQILKKMRSVDVLLLLHGEESICSEYIPSKIYEYLWMKRPILSMVFDNFQMVEILKNQGHYGIFFKSNKNHFFSQSKTLYQSLDSNLNRWLRQESEGNYEDSPYTTKAAVSKILSWVDGVIK